MTDPPRRMPAPWAVEKMPGGYCVRDAAGKCLAYIYASDIRDLIANGGLTWDEARRVATQIARLPELLPKPATPKSDNDD